MKATAISLCAAALLIFGAFMFTAKSGQSNDSSPAENNVRITDGAQIIEISAKGNYTPKITIAKADIPTIIRVSTNNTFDCTASLSIPAIGYRTNLPMSGTTDIPLVAQKAGTKLQGLCGMGMYNFSVHFN